MAVKLGFVLTFALSSLASTMAAGSKFASSVVFESLESVPNGWSLVKHADGETPIALRLAMKGSKTKMTELSQLFFAVSDPQSAKYGQFIDEKALSALTAPPQAHVATVKHWLEANKVDQYEITNEWVVFQTDVSTAETMLDTTFNWYKHSSANDENERSRLALRTLGYSVPSSISNVISMIQPTTRFGQPQPKANMLLSNPELSRFTALDNAASANSATVPSDCVYNNITASCLRQYYGVDNFHANPNTAGKVSFASFLEEYARYADLQSYEQAFVPNALGQSFAVEQINGGLNDQTYTGSSGEANLDVQMILAMSNPVAITEYSTGGRGPLIPDLDQPNVTADSNEPYLPFLQYMLSLPQAQLPHTLSISYGESEQELPVPYMRQVCKMFMQLGARGVSITVSSGDTGPGSACLSNDGTNTVKYLPAFPASCPYVTTVGGTYKFDPETAVYFSGGGFSDTFPRPAYQQEAVSSYLSLVDYANSQYYNETGRAYPDVAALGYAAAIYDQGVLTREAGTSMSSPIFAGVVANLNAARLAEGKAPLGFLNPLLYSFNGNELKDIVNGGSTGCTGTSYYTGAPTAYIPDAGFNATVGWDPVTGLGTPNFPALLASTLTVA